MRKQWCSILAAALVLLSVATLHAQTVLYDNGPLITHPGGGFGGADASVVQTAIGMSTLGFGHQVASNFRIADDFTVTAPGGWQVDGIVFYAYQTGAVTDTSTITAVNYRIWDGPPGDLGSTVIYGDTTTNRLVGSEWANIFRVTDTDMLDTSRPIMASTVSADVLLPQGTYWLDWQADGSLTSGPWAPPITTLDITTTGNAVQYTGAWGPVVESGSNAQQGLPFLLLTEDMTPTTVVLTTTITGTGSGTVESPGLTCNGNLCTGTYTIGQTVSITATADADSVLAGWVGCDSVADEVCSVAMTGDRSVSAVFDKVIAINEDAFCSVKRRVSISLNPPGHGADHMCLKRDGRPLCDPDKNRGWVRFTNTKRQWIRVARGEVQTFQVLFRQGGKGGATTGPFSASILLAPSKRDGCPGVLGSALNDAALAAYVEERLKMQAFDVVQ